MPPVWGWGGGKNAGRLQHHTALTAYCFGELGLGRPRVLEIGGVWYVTESTGVWCVITSYTRKWEHIDLLEEASGKYPSKFHPALLNNTLSIIPPSSK